MSAVSLFDDHRVQGRTGTSGFASAPAMRHAGPLLVPRVRSQESRAISCAACGITVGARPCRSCRRGVCLPKHCPSCGDMLREHRGCSHCGAPASS